MNAGHVPGAGPTVCPFVALAEDRDRRADGPDERNRCYAERAPRQRDLSYQSEFCYTQRFASCSAFLAWAARNAAEPAYVTEAARRAWGSGVSAPEAPLDDDAPGSATAGSPPAELGDGLAWPTLAGVGPAGQVDAGPPSERHDDGAETLDWVSASAWAEAPWDERAEAEAEAFDEASDEDVEPDPEPVPEVEEPAPGEAEALTAPKVPAAIPMRRRRREQTPIRTRGSGEWHYADPLDRQPIVRRTYGVGPPLVLGVLGLLVAALVVLLVPALLSSGQGGGTAVEPSLATLATPRPAATRAPGAVHTAAASVLASPEPSPRSRTYRVRSGDALSAIAERFGVSVQQLQCRNRILNRNLIAVNQRLIIPPDDYVCPRGWRNATPEPEPS